MTTKELINILNMKVYAENQMQLGTTYNDTDYPADAVYHGWNEAIEYITGLISRVHIDNYPDTEADGWVFCGKCGQKNGL